MKFGIRDYAFLAVLTAVPPTIDIEGQPAVRPKHRAVDDRVNVCRHP